VKPNPRRLILDLLSTLPRASMPVRSLVEAGELFGLSGNGVRVALARLLAAGMVERDERGQYRLGAAAGAVNALVTSWRSLERRVRAWDGGWIGAHTAGPPRAPRRGGDRTGRALRLLGFATLRPGLEVRPDNLAEGVAGVRERLHAIGLALDAPVFALGELDSRLEQRARGLWDARRLVADYRASRAALEKSLAALPGLAPERAMTESFLLGGRVIRQLVTDPLLPEPIVPARERERLLEAMRRYDEAGRACWRDFMKRSGAGRAPAPAHRTSETAAWLAPAAGGIA
jgi:phenylacetic acid degradation operon negative regulatory protein